MSDEPVFPIAADQVAAALSELLGHQGASDLSKLVRSAEASVSVDQYDNWDGGIWYCTLHLAVPTSVFAAHEERLERIEKTLGEKTRKLFKNTGSHHLSKVLISARAGAVPCQLCEGEDAWVATLPQVALYSKVPPWGKSASPRCVAAAPVVMA